MEKILEEETDQKEIPDIVVGRVPMYLRSLQRMGR